MSVIKSAAKVGFFTFLSRIIGFCRECVMAFCLGAGVYTDALLIALRLSNTFRRIFAEGAFNASFLPRFSKILHTKESKIVNQELSNIFSALLMILTVFSLLVVYFFPSILGVLISGFDKMSFKFHLTVSVGRICFSYLIFISIASLFSGVLNSKNIFSLPAFLNSLLSIFTIIAMILAYILNISNEKTLYLIAIFVLLAGMFQSYILYIEIKKNNFYLCFRWNFLSDTTVDILKNMIPGIIAAGVWQINVLMDTTIASYMPVGTITCINLADRLNQFPLGVLGISFSTVLLPSLSNHLSKNRIDLLQNDLEKSLVMAMLPAIFSTVFIYSLAEPTVAVAFQRGKFLHEHAVITSQILMGLILGLPFYVISKIFSTIYFASGDTKLPVVFGALSVLCNAICLIFLVPFFKYYGLGLCTSISAIFNSAMLIFFSLKKYQIKFSWNFKYILISQIFAGFFTYLFSNKLLKMLWSNNMGDEFIKWPIYIFILLFSLFCFIFIIFILFMMINGWNYRFWKKSFWMEIFDFQKSK